jgi:hypothetical protein
MQKGPYFQPVQYISPLPEGYMQAAASIGQSYGRAIESIGDNISGAIKKYQKDKEESEFLTGQAESLSPLLQSFQGDIRDQNTQVKFDDITKKLGNFAGQSLSQKRATLASAGSFAASFDRARQTENARVNSQLLGLQLSGEQQRQAKEAQEQTNQAAYSAAMANIPQFRDENFVQSGTAMAGLLDQSKFMNPPSSPAPNLGQFDVAALQRFQGTPPPAAPASAAPASLPPPVELTPRQAARVAESSLFSQGVNARRAAMNPPPAAPVPPVPQTSTMPDPASLAFRSDRLSATPPTVAIPQSKSPQAQNLPTVPTDTIQTRQVRTTNDEKYSAAYSKYLKEGGRLTPEADNTLRKRFNITPDVDIKTQSIFDSQGKDIGTAVIFNGVPSQIVSPKEIPGMTPSQRAEVQKDLDGRSIKFKNQMFVAPTSQEATAFRSATALQNSISKEIGELITLIDDPGTKVPGSPAFNKAKSISSILTGALRVPITGPGAVNESEYKLLAEIIADPSRFFSLAESNKVRLQELLNITDRRLEDQANSLGYKLSTTGEVKSSGANSSVKRFSTTGKEY